MKKYLAFDVGGTSVKYAVVNEEGGVSSSNKFKTPDTLEKMYQEIENVAHEYQDVEGIALSMPGAVDSDGGIIYGSSAIDYIHGPNIKEDLKHRLNKDVEFENDANCAALAEVWKGVACHENDCCFIVSGTGIGGAISSRSDLLDKVNEQLDIIFSQLTHAHVRPNIKVCQFGNDANLIGATYHYIQRH